MQPEQCRTSFQVEEALYADRAFVLHPELEHLSVEIALSPAAAQKIGTAVATHSALTRLDLELTRGNTHLPVIFSGLSQNCNLKQLHLTSDFVDCPDTMLVLSEELKKNTTI